jgi:hypothetical protein
MIDDAGTAEARLLLAELYDQITDISHKLEAIEIRGLRGLHDRRGQLRRDLYEKHTALSADACQRHLMFTLAWSHGYRTSDIEQIRCVTAEPPTPPSPVAPPGRFVVHRESRCTCRRPSACPPSAAEQHQAHSAVLISDAPVNARPSGDPLDVEKVA